MPILAIKHEKGLDEHLYTDDSGEIKMEIFPTTANESKMLASILDRENANKIWIL